MALTAPAEIKLRKAPLGTFRIADAEVVRIGGFAALNAAGDLINIADTAAFEPLGFIIAFEDALQQESETGDTSAAEPPQAIVDTDGGIVPGLTVAGFTTEATKGDLVFATDENTFTLTPTANIPAVGVTEEFESSGVGSVRFFPYTLMRTS